MEKPEDYGKKINSLELDVLADNCGIDYGGLCPPYNEKITKVKFKDY